MSEKTVWDEARRGLENERGLKEMTDRERAESIEEIRENQTMKDLRVKDLENRNIIEFADIEQEEIETNQYSEKKDKTLQLLEDDPAGAREKYRSEREEVRETIEKHEARSEMYESLESASYYGMGVSGYTLMPGSGVTAPIASWLDVPNPFGIILGVPAAGLVASLAASELFVRMKEKHDRKSREPNINQKRTSEDLSHLLKEADVVVAEGEDLERRVYQEEAVALYDAILEEAELVQTTEVDDHHPEDGYYIVDARVDAHEYVGRTEETVDEPQSFQYVLAGGEELEAICSDLEDDAHLI